MLYLECFICKNICSEVVVGSWLRNIQTWIKKCECILLMYVKFSLHIMRLFVKLMVGIKCFKCTPYFY